MLFDVYFKSTHVFVFLSSCFFPVLSSTHCGVVFLFLGWNRPWRRIQYKYCLDRWPWSPHGRYWVPWSIQVGASFSQSAKLENKCPLKQHEMQEKCKFLTNAEWLTEPLYQRSNKMFGLGDLNFVTKTRNMSIQKKLHQDLGVVIQVCSPLARHVPLCMPKGKKIYWVILENSAYYNIWCDLKWTLAYWLLWEALHYLFHFFEQAFPKLHWAIEFFAQIFAHGNSWHS